MKKLLISFAMLCAVSGAQVPVTPATIPHITFVGAAGLPCAGCSLYTYTAGTTTPFPTYTDSTGVSQNTNPIILDAAGGANIWVGRHSYKFILKDALGNTIWTVDNVTSTGLSPCGPANSIQISNSAVTGLNCDANITIDPINHTLNVGTIVGSRVTIGALGTPTNWTFDTTTPATALASLGGGLIPTCTINQLVFYAAAGNILNCTSAIPSGITATTQTPGDSSTKLATTLYVALPGPINPTSLQIASGTAVTGNQGTGLLLQHSTGTTTTDNCAKFDATGNVIDAGAPCGGAATPRTCNSNGCYRIEADGTIQQWGISTTVTTGADTASVMVNFPTSFTTTTNLSFVAWADNCADSSCTTKTPVAITGNGGPSTSLVVVYVSGVVPTGGGGSVINNAIHIHWQALGN